MKTNDLSVQLVVIIGSMTLAACGKQEAPTATVAASGHAGENRPGDDLSDACLFR